MAKVVKKEKAKVDDTKMLNTRISKNLIKRVKILCAEREITMQEFITEAISDKLAELRKA